MTTSYFTPPTPEELDLRADLMESIENFLMSNEASLQELASEIGMDFSNLDDLLCQNTLDFNLGGLVCYISKAGDRRKLSVQ